MNLYRTHALKSIRVGHNSFLHAFVDHVSFENMQTGRKQLILPTNITKPIEDIAYVPETGTLIIYSGEDVDTYSYSPRLNEFTYVPPVAELAQNGLVAEGEVTLPKNSS